MDSTEPTYNQDIKKKVSSYIKKIGYIPVADVLVQGMGHHAQEGKTEDKCKFETMDGPKSLHLPLKDVNKIGGTGTETDVNKPGIAIVFVPVNLTAEVRRNARRSPAGGRAQKQRQELVLQGTASWIRRR
ncbi:hypothetical protein pipiens_005377 [Culex pipiens pipiens]|uniref:Uncharacterized protein n=1 Tax=Culex pipiens pipiens TaxID=38569 RepID=A0ABD1DY46_CULPP